MKIFDVIKSRHSVRTFTSETTSSVFLAELCAPYTHLRPLAPEALKGEKVASYGVIKGAPAYVAVVAGDEFKAGMEGERLVLDLTARGYATCWLGGTFNRSRAQAATELAPDEKIVAVIAVGHAANRRSMLERVMRTAVRATSRKPVNEFFIAGSPASYLYDALEALALAPSACNRQPWRLAFNPSGSIDVYGDPSDSFVKVDVGIAVAHFLAMRPDYSLQKPQHSHPHLIPLATLVPLV